MTATKEKTREETKEKKQEAFQVKARLRFLRIAPRKVRLVANRVTGMDVNEAIEQLQFIQKAAKESVVKLLNSAIANAENNFQLDKNNLFIKAFIVNQGPTLKRWQPKAHGRAGMIRKRTSHVDLILEEKIPGGGVKKTEGKKEEGVKVVGANEIKKESRMETRSEERTGMKGKDSKGFSKKIFNRKTG